jgi:ABC-type phosphate/phosphonate transport system permease subunit
MIDVRHVEAAGGTAPNTPARLWQTLKAAGLGSLAGALLRDAGPLAFLAAQALYFALPVLDILGGGDEVTALARWLEDPAARHSAAGRLDQEA